MQFLAVPGTCRVLVVLGSSLPVQRVTSSGRRRRVFGDIRRRCHVARVAIRWSEQAGRRARHSTSCSGPVVKLHSRQPPGSCSSSQVGDGVADVMSRASPSAGRADRQASATFRFRTPSPCSRRHSQLMSCRVRRHQSVKAGRRTRHSTSGPESGRRRRVASGNCRRQ